MMSEKFSSTFKKFIMLSIILAIRLIPSGFGPIITETSKVYATGERSVAFDPAD
jgi:hypothetical protein